MRILCDESVELRVAQYLQVFAHDVELVGTDYPKAISDAEVLRIAVQTNRVLITNDSDFGELVFREGHPHAGIILLCLSKLATIEKASLLAGICNAPPVDLRQFVVVSTRGIRVRRAVSVD